MSWLVFGVCCVLRVARCLLRVVSYVVLSRVPRCVLIGVCRLLLVACWLLVVDCCVLFVECCFGLLYVVLFVVCGVSRACVIVVY